MRVGIGYDSHRFGPGRLLVLGGVTIPHTLGLIGHSDADAVSHALTDADSILLLVEAHRRVQAGGWTLQQCDLTVIMQAPKLAPHVPAMRVRLADALGVGEGAVSVKAKTNEGMGFIGRGEGIAVVAVATLRPV